MKKENTFDIIVIGAGSGGLNIAGFMNRAGFRALLVDKSGDRIGGDCLNFGCVPSKALIHVARMVHGARRAEAFGVRTETVADWKKVREYIKEKQDIIRAHENAEWFKSKGMTVALGKAEFFSRNSVKVDGVEYAAKKIVIATGSRPRILTGQGIEKVRRVLNNENIFDMDELPRKLLVIGAGPIGMEIAQALRFLGSEVVVSERSNAILGKEDPEMSGVVLEEMKKQGIGFRFNSALKEFISETEAIFTNAEEKEEKISFDAVFIGIGRVLNTEELALPKAGIEMKDGKIIADEYLRTTNNNVLLCGDIAGGFQFTHAAEMHASVILNNFFSPFKKKFSADHISWVTYTTPEVASFGLWEAELKKRGTPYSVLQSDFSEDDRAITDDYQYGKTKIFISPKGKILGGTMVAPNAGELIQELILANSAGLSIKNIFNKTYPYPTAARINKRLASGYFAGKLTEFNKKLLRWLY
jgi:pyruvate/2-oxoglutarate dehydrogenase complex dihydrolipoamide dehydrogenase (E3) component